jgi:CelD/BcsL family acetyltransferase involved in cellulose biosynthesis
MQIQEYTHIDQLSSLRSQWSSLLERTAAATFFQSLDWLEVYWRHFGGDQLLRVLVTSENGEPTGILPLVVRRETTRVGKLRFLTYPLDCWGSFYGPIGPHPLETLRRGLQYLETVRPDWDVLELRWLGAMDDETSRTEELLTEVGASPMRSQLDSTAVILVKGTWQDYLASKTSKWRNNARRWEKRLARQGKLQYVRHRPAGGADNDPRWDLFEQCLQIARASWQGSSQTGTTLSHQSIYPFICDTHEVAARTGSLDLNLLYLDQRPIAFAYNYVYRGHVYGLRVGFDASLCRDGAGNLLYSRAIEDSFHRRDWRYDMGPGSLECKRSWWTDVLPIYRLSCYRRLSVRQQLLRLKRNLENRALRGPNKNPTL